MELRIVYILGTIVVMYYVADARPYLIDKPEADSEQDEIMAADEIPKYMDTKDLSAFQDPDLNSMEEDEIMAADEIPKYMDTKDLSAFQDPDLNSMEEDEIMAADEIPKYMDTKDLSAFQDPDLNSMEEIAEENKINQKLLVPKSATAHDGRVKRQSIRKQLCSSRSGTTLILIKC